jgi:hypothetical protein
VLLIVTCSDEQNVFVHVPNTSGSTIDFENTFWKMFKKELHKYNRLDAIFPQPSLHIVNINTTFGHVFNNLQNCPINITYVGNLKSILALKLLHTIDSFWFSNFLVPWDFFFCCW